MITEVPVTQEDIDQGKSKDCSDCPVALALHRAFPNYYFRTRHHCSDAYSDAEHKNPAGRITHPSEVYAFIHMFDRDEPVEPFSWYAYFTPRPSYWDTGRPSA